MMRNLESKRVRVLACRFGPRWPECLLGGSAVSLFSCTIKRCVTGARAGAKRSVLCVFAATTVGLRLRFNTKPLSRGQQHLPPPPPPLPPPQTRSDSGLSKNRSLFDSQQPPHPAMPRPASLHLALSLEMERRPENKTKATQLQLARFGWMSY